jgi:ABC-2 type transport system permease protein
LFNLPHLLSFQSLVAFLIPYLLASVFFSMACSVFFWNRETPLLLYLCTSVPLLFISGLSWPGTHIHPFWKSLSYLFPSTFGINSFVQINTMGSGMSQAAPSLFALWVQSGVYFLFTFFSYKILIRRSERRALRKLVAADLHGGENVSVEMI